MARSNPREIATAPQWKGQPFAKIVGSGTWCGFTTIQSGVASVVVSTSLVKSDSFVEIVHTAINSIGAANVGSCGPIVVNSIVDSTSFAFTRSSGTAVGISTTLGWMIWRTT